MFRRLRVHIISAVTLLAFVALLPAGAMPSHPVSGGAAVAAAQRQDAAVRILRVYGRRQLRAQEAENFRVQVNDRARRPITFRWSMGDGTLAEGNNIVHSYARPGRYRVIVTARNERGVHTDSIFVTVASAPVTARTDADVKGVHSTDVASDPPADAATGAPSPARPDSPLRGGQAIDWGRGGFTLLAATYVEREAAERHALQLRRSGYRTGIVVDEDEGMSTAFRVIVGQFASGEAAASGRQRMLGTGLDGAWLVISLDGSDER